MLCRREGLLLLVANNLAAAQGKSLTYGKHLDNSERKKLMYVTSSSGFIGVGTNTGNVGVDCMSDSDVVRAKWSSLLRKRPFVAAVGDSCDAAEEDSTDRLFGLSEVNSALGNELDVDGLEWAVEVLPIQSVRSLCHERLDGGFIWFTFRSSNVWGRNNRSYCGQLIQEWVTSHSTPALSQERHLGRSAYQHDTWRSNLRCSHASHACPIPPSAKLITKGGIILATSTAAI